MKCTRVFIVAGCFVAIPFIAWLPARFWSISGEPWCLKVIPHWLDKIFYSIASPYLNQDMIIAAEQMEFIEIWFSSVVILEIIILPICYVLVTKYCNIDEE